MPTQGRGHGTQNTRTPNLSHDTTLGHRRQAHLPAECGRLVGLLPGELRQLPTEVAVAGRLAVDRPAQVQRLDDAARRQLEVLADQADELLVGQAVGGGAVRLYPDVERVGIADRVGELYL